MLHLLANLAILQINLIGAGYNQSITLFFSQIAHLRSPISTLSSLVAGDCRSPELLNLSLSCHCYNFLIFLDFIFKGITEIYIPFTLIL